MENMLKLGDSKQMRGSIWDEGGKTNIVQILVSYGQETVYSIQFVYAVKGKMLPSKVHGKPDGSKFDIVTFDDPDEYLISVRGQYYGINKLSSITFGTNKDTYGPFGGVIRRSYPHFVYNFKPKFSFGGFHGSVYKSRVLCIGVYVRPSGSIVEPPTEIDIGSDKSEDDQSSTCSRSME